MVSNRPPLHRLLVLDREIRSGSFPNANSLAKLLEVSPSTVRRDLAFLRETLHAPLQFSYPDNGYAYSEPTFMLPVEEWNESIRNDGAVSGGSTSGLAGGGSGAGETVTGNAPVEIRVRFDRGLSSQIAARDWGPGHRTQYLTDGGLELTLITANVDVLIRWVLSWGAGAEILSPPWVRRRIRELLRQFEARYGSAGSGVNASSALSRARKGSRESRQSNPRSGRLRAHSGAPPQA